MLARLRTVIPIVLKSTLGGLARKMLRLARACTGLARSLHGAGTPFEAARAELARDFWLPARSLLEAFLQTVAKLTQILSLPQSRLRDKNFTIYTCVELESVSPNAKFLQVQLRSRKTSLTPKVQH